NTKLCRRPFTCLHHLGTGMHPASEKSPGERRGELPALSRGGRERAAFVSEFQNLARVVASGYEGTDRPEEGIELGGPARREVDPEDAWVVIPEDQALSGFVAHAQKLAQVPPQLFDAGFGAQERGPTVAPSSIDEKPCEAILALQLYEI